MPDDNIEKLYKETYLKTIENSVGSKIFNSLIVRFKDSGKVVDILNDGMYSCAYFVSCVLYLFGLIDKPNTTVNTLKEKLEKNDKWKKVGLDAIEPGDVVFFEKITFEDRTENAHVGFSLNKQEAVSTDYKNKIVTRHPLFSERKIEDAFRYFWE